MNLNLFLNFPASHTSNFIALSLTPLHKKVITIAAAALACMIGIYCFYQTFFYSEKSLQPNQISVDKFVKKNLAPFKEPDIKLFTPPRGISYVGKCTSNLQCKYHNKTFRISDPTIHSAFSTWSHKKVKFNLAYLLSEAAFAASCPHCKSQIQFDDMESVELSHCHFNLDGHVKGGKKFKCLYKLKNSESMRFGLKNINSANIEFIYKRKKTYYFPT